MYGSRWDNREDSRNITVRNLRIFLVTTHYPEVKEYAAHTKDIENARMAFDKETLSPTYQMIIGEAGESCAFYIAGRLGMPNEMLKTAISATYGEGAAASYSFQSHNEELIKTCRPRIDKVKNPGKNTDLSTKYRIGDSVMVYPEKKIGNMKESLMKCRDCFIVIDNADIQIDDDIRRFINFEFSNQYMLFLRNCDGLNVSDKSFKILKLKGDKITLEEEL